VRKVDRALLQTLADQRVGLAENLLEEGGRVLVSRPVT
jgi:hypothetical protein